MIRLMRLKKVGGVRVGRSVSNVNRALFSSRAVVLQKEAKEAESTRPPIEEVHQRVENIGDSTPEEMARFRRIEVITGLLQGLGLLAVAFGGFALYKDYNYYESTIRRYWKGEELEDHTKEEEKKDVKKAPEYIEFATLKDSKSIPGVYLWGSNVDGIVVPNSKTSVYKYPQRVPFFDGMTLRDLKVNHKMEEQNDDLNVYLDEAGNTVAREPASAFAIDSNGDLIQWGKGHCADAKPRYTVRGMDFVKGEFSNSMLYLLTAKNKLMYIPVSSEIQKKHSKSVSSLIWGKSSSFVSSLDLSELGKAQVKDFKTGVNHLVVLSSDNKAYVCATGLPGENYSRKNFGQFGLLEYSRFVEAPEPNKLHEVFLLNNEVRKSIEGIGRASKEHSSFVPRSIVQIATGNYHTLARDSLGNVYSFGKNTFGQLGFQVNYNTETVSVPRKIDYFTKYFGTMNMFPIATDIQADSHSSFVTVKTKDVSEVLRKANMGMRGLDDTEEDSQSYFGFGKGLHGQLGLDFYTHANAVPKKMSKMLHNLSEYDETAKTLRKIAISSWSIGKKHVFLTLDNNDVLAFGNNRYGQLGNGKLTNTASPMSPLRLVEPADVMKKPLASGLVGVTEASQVVNVTRFGRKQNNRLQLSGPVEMEWKDERGKRRKRVLEQKIVASGDVSGIYYSS